MYIAIAIIAFGILIAVHELGHFLMARLFDIKVNEFALGMGPKLWSKQHGETAYSLRLLPLGGFCAMEGEDGDSADPRAFVSKVWWKQCIVLVAGALANFLLGFAVVMVVYFSVGQSLIEVLRSSWHASVWFVRLIIESFRMIFNGEAGIRDLSGVVGIVAAVDEVAKASENSAEAIRNVAFFFAFIAVNLGVMNLLPIPALDGGRVLFTIITAAIEKILNRKISRKAESYINGGVFVLLMLFMVFLVFNDVSRIVTK